MSRRPPPDRRLIEEAVRDAIQDAVPTIVEAVMRRLSDSPTDYFARKPPPPRTAATAVDLAPLFDAAHEGGEAAIRGLLERPIEELRPIARALDRNLGSQARRWKDVARLRDAIAAAVLRRAFRNDVFLEEDGLAGRRK